MYVSFHFCHKYIYIPCWSFSLHPCKDLHLSYIILLPKINFLKLSPKMSGRIFFLVITAILVTLQVIQGAKKVSISEATTFCEKEVPAHCISKTCPQFCSTFHSQKQKSACLPECNKDKRCKLKPAVGSDDPKNMVLDAQNRDQLWACIAETRDPAGTTTGRRPTPWKELETPEYKKAVGRPT